MSVGPFLPTSVDFTEDPSEFLIQLTDVYSNIAYAVNNRQLAFFNLTEALAGQYFTNSNATNQNVRIRVTYRQCYIIPAIVAGASVSIAINNTGATLYTHFYGGVVTANPDYRPIPYVDAISVTNQISVIVASGNIVITNGSTAPDISSGYLILEYLKN
jgi:hypothetical protein